MAPSEVMELMRGQGNAFATVQDMVQGLLEGARKDERIEKKLLEDVLRSIPKTLLRQALMLRLPRPCRTKPEQGLLQRSLSTWQEALQESARG